MPAKGSNLIDIDQRIRFLAEIIAKGGRRSDCVQYAAETWGVSERTCDSYLVTAREQLKADWDLQRPQMIADLLSQCSTLQREARAAQQYHIALGCINTAAKLAKLVS